MAGVRFKQTQIYPGVTKHRTNAVTVYCDGAVTANDILSVTGVQGNHMKVAPADANGAVTLNNSLLYVADYAAASGAYTPVAIPWKVVVGVDTSSATIGDPVYLSDTAGSFSLTTGSIKIGTVLTAATAANDGTILLAPQSITSTGGIAYGAATTMIGSGAQDVAISITQPAGTVITDAGCVLTTATVGSQSTNVKFGTALDGAEICAAKAFISSGVGAIGSSIAVSGAQGEGATALTFVADAALYTAAARTIYFRSENDGTLTAGVIRPFIKFERI
jgi:hypothetical protein